MNRMFGPTLPEPTRALGKTSANTGTTAVNVLPVQVPSLGSVAAALSSVKDQFARNTQHPLARQEDLERAAARNDSRLFGAQIILSRSMRCSPSAHQHLAPTNCPVPPRPWRASTM